MNGGQYRLSSLAELCHVMFDEVFFFFFLHFLHLFVFCGPSIHNNITVIQVRAVTLFFGDGKYLHSYW